MKKVIVLLVILMVTGVVLQAQRPAPRHPGRDNAARLIRELDLSPEQEAELAAINEDFARQRKDLAEKDFESPQDRRAAMQEVMQAHRQAVNDILTDEQQAQLQEKMQAHRQEMRQRRDAIDQKAMREALRTYREENILPVMRSQRAKLEGRLSAEDKAAIDGLRERLEKERPAPGEHPAKMSPEDRMQKREAFREAHQADREQLKGLVEKYDADITALLEEVKPQAGTWKAGMKAIADKYRPEPREGKERPEGKRGQWEGKGRRPGPAPAGKGLMGKGGFLLLDPNAPAPPAEQPVQALAELQVFPNPATDRGTLSYTLRQSGTVRVELRGENGKLIRVLEKDKNQEAGKYQVEADLAGLRPGVYYFTVISQGRQESVKFVISN